VKRLIGFVVRAVLAFPVAVVVTLLLTPVWRWLERVSAVESIGHSGPAARCFVLIYLATLALGLLPAAKRAKSASEPARSN
jgi:hypothetical protein